MGDRWGFPSRRLIVRTSGETDSIDGNSDEVPELSPVILVKMICILLQTHSEEEEEH